LFINVQTDTHHNAKNKKDIFEPGY